MHWGRGVVGRDLARHFLSRTRLGTRTYFPQQDVPNFAPDPQQPPQQFQVPGSLGPGQGGQGQGRGRGRGVPFPSQPPTAGVPGQPSAPGPFGGAGGRGSGQQVAWTAPQPWDGASAGGPGQPGAHPSGAGGRGSSQQTARTGWDSATAGGARQSGAQAFGAGGGGTSQQAAAWAGPQQVFGGGDGSGVSGDPRGLAAGSGWQAAGAGIGNGNAAVTAQGLGPATGRPGFGSSQAAQAAGSVQGYGFPQVLQGLDPSQASTDPRGVATGSGWQAAGTGNGNAVAADQGLGPSTGVSGFGLSQATQASGSVQGYGFSQVPQVSPGLNPFQSFAMAGPPQSHSGTATSQGVTGIRPSQDPQNLQGFVSPQAIQNVGPAQGHRQFEPLVAGGGIGIGNSAAASQGLGVSAGFSGIGSSQAPQALGSVQGYGFSQVPQGLDPSQFLPTPGVSQSHPGVVISQGLTGMMPSQNPQNFQDFPSLPQPVQGVGPAQGFEHAQGHQQFGHSQSLSRIGPVQNHSGVGSFQGLSGIGPAQNVSTASQSTQGFMSSQAARTPGPAQGFGFVQVHQGFEPAQGLSGIGPSQGHPSMGASQGLPGLGTSQSHQGFVGSQNMQGFVSSQAVPPVGLTQGFEPAQGLSGTGPSQGHPGMGPSQSHQGFAGSQNTHGFVSSLAATPVGLPQGFESAQGLSGIGPSQGHLLMGASQGFTGMGPSQAHQGFAGSPSTQGFVSSQAVPPAGPPQGFDPAQGLYGIGPSQGHPLMRASQGFPGMGPSQSHQAFAGSPSTQGFVSSQAVPPVGPLQGFNAAQGLSGAGPSQGHPSMGASQGFPGMGPSQIQGFAGTQNTQGFVSSQAVPPVGPPGHEHFQGPSRMGPAQGLSGTGLPQGLSGIGHFQSREGLPGSISQGSVSPQVPPGFGFSQVTPGFGLQQIPHNFGSSQSPQGFVPVQVPQWSNASQAPQGFGPSQVPQVLGSSQVPQGFGYGQASQGFDVPQGLQGFGPSGAQGVGYLQGPQQLVPSQVVMPSQDLQSYPPSQALQNFVSSQSPPGFVPLQSPGYIQEPSAGIQGPGFAVSQGQGFAPSQGQDIGHPNMSPSQGQSPTHGLVKGQFQAPELSQVPLQHQQPWNLSDTSSTRKPESSFPLHTGQVTQSEHEGLGLMQPSQLPLPPTSGGTESAVHGVQGDGKVHPTADSLHPQNYAAMIETCFRQGRLNEVEVLFEEMKRAQVPVQISTYNVLMEMYSRSGQLEKLDQIYKDMRLMAAGLRHGVKDQTSNAEQTVSRSTHPFPGTPIVAAEQPSVSLAETQEGFSRAQASQWRSPSDSSPDLFQKASVGIPGPIFSDSVKPAEFGPQSPRNPMPSSQVSPASVPAVELESSKQSEWKSQPQVLPALKVPVSSPLQSSPLETPKPSEWSPVVSGGRPLSPLPGLRPSIQKSAGFETPDVAKASSEDATATSEPARPVATSWTPIETPVAPSIQKSTPFGTPETPAATPKAASLTSEVPVSSPGVKPSTPKSAAFETPVAFESGPLGVPSITDPSILSGASSKAAEASPTTSHPVTPQESVTTITDAVKPESIPQPPHSKAVGRGQPLQFPGLSFSPKPGSGRGQVMSRPDHPDYGVSSGQIMPETSRNMAAFGRGQDMSRQPGTVAALPVIPRLVFQDVPPGLSTRQVLPDTSIDKSMPDTQQEASTQPRTAAGTGAPEVSQAAHPRANTGIDQPVLIRGQETTRQQGAAAAEPVVPLTLFGQRPDVRPGFGRGRGRPAEAAQGMSQYPPRLQNIRSPEEAAQRARDLLLPGAERVAGAAPVEPYRVTPPQRMQLSPEEAAKRAQAILLESAERDIASLKESLRRKQAIPKQGDELNKDEAVKRAMSILEQNLRNVERATSSEEVEKRSKGKFERFSGFAEVTQPRRAVSPTSPTSKSGTFEIRSDRRTGDTSLSADSRPSRVTRTPEMELQDADDAAKSALHQAFRVDFDPQYAMEDFGKNPDIEEKPLPTLEEALQEAKHLLMPLEGLVAEDDWQARVKETLERSPELDKLVEAYGGPARMTARQQNEQLDVEAKKLPPHASPEITAFTQRALLTLQNNPSWNFAQKERLMKNVVSGFANY